jgi:hypothetical protein
MMNTPAFSIRFFLPSVLAALTVAGCPSDSNELGRLPNGGSGGAQAPGVGGAATDAALQVDSVVAPNNGGATGTGGGLALGGTTSGSVASGGTAGGSGGATTAVGGGLGGGGAGSTGVGGTSGGSTGTQCGSIAGIACPSTADFCQLATGDCRRVADSWGTCTKVPAACAAVSTPVCGCDGKTYDNDCARQLARVSKVADGACAAGSGGSTGGSSTQPSGGAGGRGGSTSAGSGGSGGAVNATGGSGGAVNATGGSGGAVNATGGSGGASNATGGSGGTGTGGSSGDRCGSISGIPCTQTGQFCQLVAGLCLQVSDSWGTCADVPAACADVFAPVCGCDRKTYTNDCLRQAARASKAYDGDCLLDGGA